MSIDIRFFNERATCALCGREVDPGAAIPLAETGADTDASSHGTHMLIDVTLQQLVICTECAKAD